MKIDWAGNGVYYYDFDSERKLDNWKIKSSQGKSFVLDTSFEAPKDDRFTLVFHYADIKPIDLKIDDKSFLFNWVDSEIAYVAEQHSPSGLTYAFKINLKAGVHHAEFNLEAQTEESLKSLKISWLNDPVVKNKLQKPRQVIIPGSKKNVETKESPEPDLKNFKPGIGTEPCAGRFGFSKGDGMLDCGMPLLGVVDKLYPCGHPDYNKPYKWTISFLPYGIDPHKKYHGSHEPAQVGVDNDKIIINHLSVNWQSAFDTVESFFERKAGEKVNFACTYSLGSPGILIESSDPGISLSMLETAGNYQYMLIPQKNGASRLPLIDDFVFDGNMTENWMLLFGATEFPDIPILMVFEKAPSEIKVKRTINGRLQSLDFHIPPKDAKLIAGTPFGIESFLPESSNDNKFIVDAIERCRFWSRAFLAYPIKCEDYFRLEEESEKVEVIQRFEYRTINDQWNTIPLRTAPLPPPLTILDGTDIVEPDKEIQDFKFPTKYGFLRGVTGRSFSSYKIPFMPCERKFPLKNCKDNTISRLLEEDIKKYFVFHEHFDKSQHAYSYPGAAMEPYAWSSPLFNFMDNESREKLSAKCSERLKASCLPDRRYKYLLINFRALFNEMPGVERVIEIYRDPNMRYIDLYNWYPRKEPFSGVEYKHCYFNISTLYAGMLKTGELEEVAALKEPLIENDWGMGLTFYYMYLCALISGDFAPVKENWRTLTDAFKYFEVLHDWACMGTGVCDNGRGWVEGANYGAFTSMVNMAQAVGENQDYAKSVYLAAKQLILRLAIFRSGIKYFPRFFKHGPWFVTKSFREEDIFNNGYLHVPCLLDKATGFTGIYNLTTEGLYPELFQALLKYLPEEWAKTREFAISALLNKDIYTPMYQHNWPRTQAVCSCLIAAALDEKFDEEQLRKEMREAENKGYIIKGWRGIHIYSRLLPENYFKCQLLAWLENRKTPAWLEHWTGAEIIKAEYDSEKQKTNIEFKLTGEKGFIRLGIRKSPIRALLNGQETNYEIRKKTKLEIKPSSSGILELIFRQRK